MLVRNSLVILFILRSLTEADMFTTLADMEHLLHTQTVVIKNLYTFVSKEKKRVEFLEGYLNRIKKEYEMAVEDVPYYLGNPINAFTIIKRLSHDLTTIENIIKDKTGYTHNSSLVYPSKEDLLAAIVGFSRVQKVYHLNTSELANGVVSGAFRQNKEIYRELVVPMTASDCYYIGNISFTNKFFQEAIPWFIEAWNKLDRDGCDLCPFTDYQLMDQISQSYYILGDYRNTILWVNRMIIALKPDDPDTTGLIKFANLLQDHIDRKAKKAGLKGNEIVKLESQETTKISYSEALCQGKIKIIKRVARRLHCYYVDNGISYLPLMRAKAEVLYKEPDIVMFHDIVNDLEIKSLLDLAKPVIWKNGTLSNVTRNADSYYRNAKSVSFENITSKLVDRVADRISLFTGLRMENSEPLRIIHYGIGGIYEMHFDCNTVGQASIPFFQKYGDRIATIMIYLTNVALGGATVFPELRLTVFPKKGAALFWMNLVPSGERDDEIIHAACPVLRGSKWIAIKWPHEVPQQFCPLWKTKLGLMDEQKHQRFSEEVRRSRQQTQHHQRARDEL